MWCPTRNKAGLLVSSQSPKKFKRIAGGLVTRTQPAGACRGGTGPLLTASAAGGCPPGTHPESARRLDQPQVTSTSCLGRAGLSGQQVKRRTGAARGREGNVDCETCRCKADPRNRAGGVLRGRRSMVWNGTTMGPDASQGDRQAWVGAGSCRRSWGDNCLMQKHACERVDMG